MITQLLTNPTLGPWVTVAKSLWPLVWRVALLIAVGAVGWHFGEARAERRCEEAQAATAAAVVAGMEEMNRRVAERDAQLEQKEVEYVAGIRELEEQQRRTPARVVRLCPDARDREVPGVSGAAPGNADHAAGGGELQGGAGRDIGPDLKQLTDRADRLAYRCLAIQGWTDTLAAQSEP